MKKKEPYLGRKSFTQLKLPPMIKEKGFQPLLTTNQVWKNLKKYNEKKEPGSYSERIEWQAGYLCALRDAERITYETWNELVARVHGHRRTMPI